MNQTPKVGRPQLQNEAERTGLRPEMMVIQYTGSKAEVSAHAADYLEETPAYPNGQVLGRF